VLTTGNGRFAFFDLPAGTYSIDAVKPGYMPGAYGRLRSGGIAQSMDLADGARVGNLSIKMWQYAAITGTVTDEAGEPVVGVQVVALRRVIDSGRPRLSPSTSSSLTPSGPAVTDDRGAFRLASLVPGQYVLCVPSTIGTIPVEMLDAYQQARQEGTMPEWSRQMSGNGIGLSSLGLTTPGFRIGDKVVQIVSGFVSRPAYVPGPGDDGRMAIYPTTYYPGTFAAGEAQVLTLASGEERTGVFLPLKLAPATSVAGTVVGPDGPVARVGVRLVSSDAQAFTIESTFDTATTVTDSRGRFEFFGVPMGQYAVRVLKIPPPTPRPPVSPAVSPVPVPGGTGAAVRLAPYMPPVPEGPTLWANVPVTVGEAGVADLTVTLQRGVRVAGHFEFDGTQPRPAPEVLQSLSIAFLTADGRNTGSTTPLQATIDSSGRISTYEIPPGRYIVRYGAFLESRQALGQWVFRNATIGGRDVSALSFDLQTDVSDLVVTMTDHPTELTGTVLDTQGRIDSTAAVIIISTNRAGWSNYGTNPVLLRMVRPGKDGTYRLFNFSPGEYYAVAIPEAQADDWQNPEVLEAIVRGAPTFTIRAGEKKRQDVTTRPVR
jgi:hypothetical protein